MAEKSGTGPRVSVTGPADAFDSSPLDLGANDEAPPAYGELHNQLNLSQAGFNADAAVTNDGRISICINQTSGTLADLLGPALTRSQLMPPQSLPSEPLPPAYVPPSLGGQPGQTPPPKLNVVIQIVGSRGDVQPFVALGKVLKETYGHRVRVATHAVFQSFVEENGLEFFAIGGDPAELMAFMVKHPGLMPGFDAVKSGEITKRRRGIEQIILGCWRSCVEAGDGLGPPPEPHQSGEPLSTFTSGDYSLPGQPSDKPFVADAIIANPPSFAHIHIAEKMGIPLHMMFTMPWSPTKAFPHPLANIESSNAEDAMTNYVSYALVEMMTWQGLGDVINRFRTKVLDLEPMSLIWAPGLLTRLHIPTTYCWSPALIPKPRDWGCEINISGFYFLDLATSYTPDPDLAAFLDAGPPPVYIGFGSIVVDDPNKLTRMIFDAITLAGVRALVSKGWGGLGADSVGIPDGVFMLGNCPHDWLFKRVSCVVHHGGAGTTAAGIKTGTPTVIVPFFGDQPFWGSMIAQAGAGPKPIRYADLTAESLAESITTALKPDTQARAKELGERIRAERGTDQGAKSFHDSLDYEKLRCSLSPSRIAVWRVRRTQVRLSALAAAVLVQEGVLQYTDLKLYRSQEYDTEEQPWDPVTAVTSSLVGDVGTMALAIQDIPSNWIKMAKKTTPGPGTPTSVEDKETAGSSTSFDGGSTTTAETRPSQANTTDSDAASVFTTSTAAPATLSPPGSAKGTDSKSNRPGFRSRKSAQSIFTSRSRSKSPMPPTDSQPSSPTPLQSPSNFNIEAALGASIETGKGVQRIVGTGMKTPMNFCMGLAKGFRNAPRLYNDQTVRKQEKVTGLASGVMVAGKEFGLGLFDGITGLVTQPLQGAEKEGAKGLIKGIGKGIGGIVLKPSAGFWAVPAYVMKGLHAEVRGKFHKSVENYIIVSRILQGQDDLRYSTGPEQKDIIMRFNILDDKLKGFHHLKAKVAKQSATQSSDSTSSSATATAADNSTADDDIQLPEAPPKTGFRATRHLSFSERKKLHAQKDAWKKGKAAAGASGVASQTTSQQPAPHFRDEELERAIQESVVQTSRGNEAEDALIENQIRVGVVEMRRIAEEKARQRQRQMEEDERLMRDFKVNPFANGSGSGGSANKPLGPPPALPARQQPVSSLAQSKAQEAGVTDAGDETVDDRITDEEFEELVAEAVRRSIAAQGGLGGPEGYNFGQQQPGDGNDEDDENLRRALEESLREVDKGDPSASAAAAASGQQGHHLPQQQGYEQGNDNNYNNNDDDDDDENNEELKRALEESERAHKEHLARRSTQRSEEEIIMEYVTKQSLAEEEFRLQKAAREGQGGEKRNEGKNEEDHDEDEDMRKAMEESLLMSEKEGEPSGEKK